MFWFEKIAQKAIDRGGPITINDSKTPSGQVHVGSLRGVLIHEAIHRQLNRLGVPNEFLYGVDDYDPLDGLPADAGPELSQHMGKPLCQSPAPSGSPALDMADHYINDFLELFPALGSYPDIYKMRDMYRSGKFDEAIDRILNNSDVVRAIYLRLSGSKRPADWHPFQVICENCGKIGTTVVTSYYNSKVLYHCAPELVQWAQGCGYRGEVSPFGGRGKLPWKLEWAAKWHVLGVSVEGAGKDHCTKGGSRDIAAACARQIFGMEAPLNIPYEFFLVGGAKMSSSRGIGSSAREMCEFLDPDLLRFLMIKTLPKRSVDFSTNLDYMSKTHNEFDRLVNSGDESEKRIVLTTHHSIPPRVELPTFQWMVSVLQMPHLNHLKEIADRYPDAPDTFVNNRRNTAATWLARYADESEKISIQHQVGETAAALADSQRVFLRCLAAEVQRQDCFRSEEDYQSLIFDVARLTPLSQPEAFKALYALVLDKSSGPKGGALLSFLEPSYVVAMVNKLKQPSLFTHVQSTMIATEELSSRLQEAVVEKGSLELVARGAEDACTGLVNGTAYGVLNLVVHAKGKSSRLYAHLFTAEDIRLNLQKEAQYLYVALEAVDLAEELKKSFEIGPTIKEIG